jgi:hypothetical protein
MGNLWRGGVGQGALREEEHQTEESRLVCFVFFFLPQETGRQQGKMQEGLAPERLTDNDGLWRRKPRRSGGLHDKQ